MSFSKNLSKLRKANGLSQEELAEKLDISRQAVSKWESEKSKPDIGNVVKLSKIFEVGIDDLIGNEVIKTDAFSINIEEDSKTKKIFKYIRGVIACAVGLFILIVIYKFIMLFRITKIGEHYKELNNYHYLIYTYRDNNILKKEECWFKDGVSKTIQTLYSDNNEETRTICIDYNINSGYTLEGLENRKEEIDVQEYLLFRNGYEHGGQLYSNFPTDMKENKVINILTKCIVDTNLMIKEHKNNVFFSFGNNYINLEKDTLLPLTNYHQDIEDGFELQQYEIELNSVDEIKI